MSNQEDQRAAEGDQKQGFAFQKSPRLGAGIRQPTVFKRTDSTSQDRQGSIHHQLMGMGQRPPLITQSVLSNRQE